jgi:hypothetical protein
VKLFKCSACKGTKKIPQYTQACEIRDKNGKYVTTSKKFASVVVYKRCPKC